MRRPLLAALLLGTLAVPVAEADPGGEDGPDHPTRALLLEAGTYEGALVDGDHPYYHSYDEDWYAVHNPWDAYVRVTLTITGPLNGVFETRHYNTWETTAVEFDLVAGQTETATITDQNVGSRIFIGVSGYVNTRTPANYTLTIEVLPAPDFAIGWSWRFEDEPADPLAEGGHRLPRRITFDVTNYGPAAGVAQIDVVLRTPTDGRTTHLATVPLALASNETGWVEVKYDAFETGNVGDSWIYVHARVPFDSFEGDNMGSMDDRRVSVPFYWVGVTAWSQHAWCRADVGDLCFRAQARPSEVSAHHTWGVWGSQSAAAFVTPHVVGAYFVHASPLAYTLVEAQRYADGGGFVDVCPAVGPCVYRKLPDETS